jgi:asparagine synthetase B (glutamine-hydrolysing)
MEQPDWGTSPPAWLAAFGAEPIEAARPAPAPHAPPVSVSGAALAPARYEPPPVSASGRTLAVLASPPDWSPTVARQDSCEIVFDGVLYEQDELRARLPDRLPPQTGVAELVAAAYRHWGEGALPRLVGAYALLIWDSARDVLLAVRDATGKHPLFYAEAGRMLLLSPAVETLIGHPSVPAALNRARLVDHLARRWTRPDETYFAHVRRVPPGHVLRLGPEGSRVYRYWQPLPPAPAMPWIPDDEAQARFDALLKRTVARGLELGPSAVYLSGGLDSSAIAMVAAELSQRADQPTPWALSLVFPGFGADEPAEQTSVAETLGFPQVQLSVDEAAGSKGNLAVALEMSGSFAAPLSAMWRPAFLRLAQAGKERGCRVVLTGDGADEWLFVPPYWSADLLRSANLLELYRLWRTLERFAPLSPTSRSTELRGVWWQCCAWPLLRQVWHTAPLLAPARRLRRPRRGLVAQRAAASPPWLAPDPALRTEVAQRIERALARDERLARTDSFYLREKRLMLDLPQKWAIAEEMFVFGQRAGVQIQQPFWDADLVQLLSRTHPRALNRNGVTKALVRGALAQRFPGAGFATRRKSFLGWSFHQVLPAEVGQARQALGGLRTLAELGVVEPSRVAAFLDDPLAAGGPGWWGVVWELLNLEAWARAH